MIARREGTITPRGARRGAEFLEDRRLKRRHDARNYNRVRSFKSSPPEIGKTSCTSR